MDSRDDLRAHVARTPGTLRARSRSLCGIALLLSSSAAACAHEQGGTSRVLEGRQVVGRDVSVDGYASALRLALIAHGVLDEDRTAAARLAILENPGDDEVVALAVDAAGDDANVVAAARPWRGRSCAVDVALARREPSPAPVLAALLPRCPLATMPAIYASLAIEDAALAGRLAMDARASNDPDTQAAVLDALVRLEEPAPLEAFVALHVDDPRLVARVTERASRLPPPLSAAMLSPLAERPSHVASAAVALHEAGRDERARELLASASAREASLDDTLRLAELALDVGVPARSLELADLACAQGASSRCDAIASRALQALGRAAEAEVRAARSLP